MYLPEIVGQVPFFIFSVLNWTHSLWLSILPGFMLVLYTHCDSVRPRIWHLAQTGFVPEQRTLCSRQKSHANGVLVCLLPLLLPRAC
jgi:hypothetical protein